jgi:DNA replication protein DnaC
LKGTAIDLANEKNTGATQVPAAEFLAITYPSGDLLKSLEAVGPNQEQHLVLIGERDLGKSHLMAALHHSLSSPSCELY